MRAVLKFFLFIVLLFCPINISESVEPICPDPQPISGWPVGAPETSGQIYSHLVVGDVSSQTPGNETVQTSTDDLLRIWSSDGQLLLEVDAPVGTQHYPSLSDVNGDGDLEVFLGSFERGLFLIDIDEVSSFVHHLASGYASSNNHAPVIADLNDDGWLEVVDIAIGSCSGLFPAEGCVVEGGILELRVLDAEIGEVFPGWPVVVADPTRYFIWHSSVSVADLDNDLNKEIVIMYKHSNTIDAPTVVAYDHDGTVRWTHNTPFIYAEPPRNSGSRGFNDVVIGDVDANGNANVIYYQNGNKTITGESHIVVLEEDQILHQWNIPPSIAWVEEYRRPDLDQISLGDLDRDGDLEIVMAAIYCENIDPDDPNYCRQSNKKGRILAWHHDGQIVEGYPVTIDEKISSPRIADVNGDQYPDIVSSTGDGGSNLVYAWDRHGTLLDCWPKSLTPLGEPPLQSTARRVPTTLADLDGNGTLDLMALVGDGINHAIDLGVPVNPETMHWPQYRHDSSSSGSIPSVSDSISAVFKRGDADRNGSINLTDGIMILNQLFRGGEPSSCEDAVDVDDNGFMNISDVIYLFNFLFQGKESPPDPGPVSAGVDPTEDNLTCRN